MPTNRIVRVLLAVLLALSVAAVGCGDDGESDADATPEAAQTATPEPADGEALTDLGSKPPVSSPGGDPPTKLVKEDIVKGKGKRAKPGDTLSVQYVGVSFSTGQEFDASWDRGQPFEFQLGAGQVISGWDQGLVGMKEGGRRRLTIPPDMAYGPEGSPPAIGPNETLIFIVDLEKVG